jgi:hypothetical protein
MSARLSRFSYELDNPHDPGSLFKIIFATIGTEVIGIQCYATMGTEAIVGTHCYINGNPCHWLATVTLDTIIAFVIRF